MSDPSLDYLADRKRKPGYGLLRITQRTVEATLAGDNGGGLAIEFAREVINLQERLRVTIEWIVRLERLIKSEEKS